MAGVGSILFYEGCKEQGQYVLEDQDLYSSLLQDDNQAVTNISGMAPAREELQSSDLQICETIGCSTTRTCGPDTHIEIIKSYGFRRVSGANRVVPLLTNTLKTGKYSSTSFGIVDVYKNFLSGLHSDNRQCMVCQQECLSPADLLQHVTIVHHSLQMDIVPEQCFVCRKVYVFKDRLLYHLSQIHGIQAPDLICKTCFMEFNTTMEQKAHERKHEGVYSCHLCVKKFSSEYLCQKHVNDHFLHSRQKECKKCGKRFRNNSILQMHEKRHDVLKCYVCAVELQNEISALHHLKGHRSEDIQKFLTHTEECDENEVKLEEMYNVYIKLASKRGRHFSNKEEDRSVINCVTNMVNTVLQVNNLETAEKKQGVQCRLCDISVRTPKELMDHRKKFHLRSRTCLFCGKRNRTVSQAWRHMKTHLSNSRKSQHLVENDRKYLTMPHSVHEKTSNTALRKQSNGKTAAQLYSCSICSRRFMNSNSRDMHMQEHNKKSRSNWRCDECGFKFENEQLLLKHICAHKVDMNCSVSEQTSSQELTFQKQTKERKMFKCNLCFVKCPSKSGLQMHRRCHTGERPYACGQCHKKFKRLQAVKKHIQIVHKTNLHYHVCSECPKQFSTFGNLLRHYMRVHCFIRRFICGLCGIRYGQNQDLQRHLKVIHQLDMPSIHGVDRKSLNEVYVIPGIENLPQSHPHTEKIAKIVEEEKAKFDGVSRMLRNKNMHQEKSTMKTIQFIQENAKDLTEKTVLAVPLQVLDRDDITDGEEITITNVIGETHLVPPGTNDTKQVSCSVSNNEVEIFTCSCNQIFLEEQDYMSHSSQQNTTCTTCKQCNTSFANCVALKEHITSQHRTWSCSVCSQNFSDKISFTKHMQEVEGIGVLDLSEIQRQPICEGSTLESTNLRSFVVNNENCAASTDSQPVAASYSDVTSVIANNIPTTMNVNGIIVQNIIVQSLPVLQTVPLPFPVHSLLQTNQVYTPYVTFDSSTMPSIQEQDNSLVTIGDINNLRVGDFVMEPLQASVGCLPEVNQVATAENIVSSVIATPLGNMHAVSENPHGNSSAGDPKGVPDQLNTEVLYLTEVNSSDNSNERMNEAQVICKKFDCKECAEHFPNATALNRHMKTHRKSMPHACPHCGKCFTEKHNLKTHIMVHTGERPYECEDCGKKLRYKKCVWDHKHMHSGFKPFECDQCGRRFIRQRELNRHKNIHTGEKKYVCPICGKAFGRLDQLKQAHLPIHETDKSSFVHTCGICDKSFRTKAKLKYHEELHSDLKRFQCDICKKRFVHGRYLKSHLQSHKKRDSYIQCSKCSRKFVSEHTLQIHDTTFHGKIKKTKQKMGFESENILTGERAQNSNYEMESVDGIGIDIEIQDTLDLNALNSEDCNAVIYLHMESEELKVALNNATDV